MHQSNDFNFLIFFLQDLPMLSTRWVKNEGILVTDAAHLAVNYLNSGTLFTGWPHQFYIHKKKLKGLRG